jgi:hypothetical protein
MGTRGVIARHTGEGKFKGRYHHWDSYPSGLGKTLFHVRLKEFNSDTEAMLKFLLDDHIGWSSINDSDWKEEPGYGEEGPQCYCHGERDELGWWSTEKDASESGCEWAYVFKDTTMLILSSYTSSGNKMIGMFGFGDPNATWKCVAMIDLDGEEPDWKAIESNE